MKKLLLLIALTSLFTINTTAKTVPGQIIFENDTIDVQLRIPKNIFIYPDYAKLQRKVKYINSKGKKKVLRPKDAIEFSFVLEGELIRMVTKKHPLGKRFFRLEIDGKLKLLSFFAIDFSSGDNNISSVYSDKKYYFLEKDDNIVLSKKWPLFPSQMSKYLADCPILVEKIKHGEYRNSNLPEMVNAYNETCSSENQ